MGNAAAMVQGCEGGEDGEACRDSRIAASNRRMSAPDAGALSAASRVSGSLNFDHLVDLAGPPQPRRGPSPSPARLGRLDAGPSPSDSFKMSCRELQQQGHHRFSVECGAEEGGAIVAHRARRNRRATLGTLQDPHVLQRLHAVCTSLDKEGDAREISLPANVRNRSRSRSAEPLGVTSYEPPPPSPSVSIFTLAQRQKPDLLPEMSLCMPQNSNSGATTGMLKRATHGEQRPSQAQCAIDILRLSDR